eukprot:5431918-Prorocentrum_lima.AAC.1
MAARGAAAGADCQQPPHTRMPQAPAVPYGGERQNANKSAGTATFGCAWNVTISATKARARSSHNGGG